MIKVSLNSENIEQTRNKKRRPEIEQGLGTAVFVLNGDRIAGKAATDGHDHAANHPDYRDNGGDGEDGPVQAVEQERRPVVDDRSLEETGLKP